LDLTYHRHSRESLIVVIPAKAGTQGHKQRRVHWGPAFAGMTTEGAAMTTKSHLRRRLRGVPTALDMAIE
jgi:hypothetical protein